MIENVPVLQKRSADLTSNGEPKAPTIDKLQYGEIAINYAAGKETLFIRNSNDEIVGSLINGVAEKALAAINEHVSRTDNPHGVTKEQVGLGNVDNTSDIDKPVSNATQELIDRKLEKTAVVDNLTTNSSTEALSAAQGIELKKMIEEISGGVSSDLTGLITRIAAVEEEVDNTESIEDGIISKEETMIADFAE